MKKGKRILSNLILLEKLKKGNSNTSDLSLKLQNAKKILIVRLRLIGDVLMTTPSIKILKNTLPEAKIFYLVEPPQDEILRGNPDIDELIILKRDASLKELFSVIKKMRKEKFDFAIDFHGGPRASFLTLFSGAKIRVGYDYSPRRAFYHLRVQRGVKDGYIHSVVNQFNLIKGLGIERNDIPPLFMPEIEDWEREKFDRFIIENGLDGKRFIVFHVSAGNKYREWGIENWKSLIKIVTMEKRGLKIALIGSEKDLIYEEHLKFPDVVSLIGRINLREVRELIKRSILFVGPDSGPMHIASTTETPVIALFGPTTPRVFGPWKKDAIIIEGSTDCRPCNQKRCDYNFKCLREIKPETVFEMIKKILK